MIHKSLICLCLVLILASQVIYAKPAAVDAFKAASSHQVARRGINDPTGGVILDRLQEVLAAFNSTDAELLASFFTEDCIFMAPANSPIYGRAGIQSYFEEYFAQGGTNVGVQQLDDLDGDDNWVWEAGHYTIDGSRGPEGGNYVHVWKNVDGTWYIDVDIFNIVEASDQPPVVVYPSE